MFFIIRKFEVEKDDETVEAFTWTLHRKDKTAENDLGEAICRGVAFYASQRQTRAAINIAKKAMSGVRFAQTRVAE